MKHGNMDILGRLGWVEEEEGKEGLNDCTTRAVGTRTKAIDKN